MGWVALQLRDFEIPVEGGPHLTTADDWRTELDVLSRDIAAFWRDTLERASLSYDPPTIVSGFEGPRPVCGGLAVTEATVFCLRSSTIHLNRIRLNGISRASNAGKNHLAIAYTVARLMGRQTQTALGVDLAPKETADAERRLRLELQAECFAGLWLRHATQKYGPVSDQDLRSAVRAATVSAPAPGVPNPEILEEDFLRTPIEQRIEWARRGFHFAEHFLECAPKR